jgi:tRNA dimethylallyltransferase
VIAGPTAIGKTALAIEIAQHFKSVILSADARQFYKELNIGAAKPDQQQLNAVKHYFVNTKNINELYGAGHFEKDAMQTLLSIFEKDDMAILVGGSGLYINTVLHGVDNFVEVPQEVRIAINSEFNQKGLEWLQKEVALCDHEYFKTADTDNPQRLIRALEIYRHTGHKYSSFLSNSKMQRDFIPIKILLNTERDKLYGRINQRVDDMVRSGLIEEAKQLFPSKAYNALKTVGYSELFDYFEGKCSLETAIDKIKQHTRNYAKRQLTWFKNKDQFTEFEPEDSAGIIKYINNIMKDGTRI